MSNLQPQPDQWIEIFHSKPSMKRCFLLEQLPNGQYTDPSLSNMLVDASYIREGFRVYRTRSRRLEFVLTNGSNREWQDDNGRNYIIDAIPGRYVVEHGIRRVDDADNTACRQAVLRPNDTHIHLVFRADLWEKCFCNFRVDDKEWTPTPGQEMIVGTGPSGDTTDAPEKDGKYFFIVVKGQRLVCAFSDGGENWDSKQGFNYMVGLPGRYHVYGGEVKYVSPAFTDLQKEDKDTSSKDVSTSAKMGSVYGTENPSTIVSSATQAAPEVSKVV